MRSAGIGRIAAVVLAVGACGAKEAGVFYSTLYAWDPAYRMTRLSGMGAGAAQNLFGDVDGDGRDDAVAVFRSTGGGLRAEVALSNGSDFVAPAEWLSWPAADGTERGMLGDVTGDGRDDLVLFRNAGGRWFVAVSGGAAFGAPAQWSSGNGYNSDFQFLGDVDGDGRADAIISWRSFNNGDWRAGVAGDGSFGTFALREQGFGGGAGQTHFVGDLNADRRADLVAWDNAAGDWSVSITGGGRIAGLEQGFGAGAEFAGVFDVDGSGTGDLVFVHGEDAYVRYLRSDLTLVQPRHRWFAGGRSGWRGLYPDAVTAVAAMDGSGRGQLFCVYNGTWQAFPPNPDRGRTVVGSTVNTWETWTNHYLPRHPVGEDPADYGYYDSGDPAVNDAQIRRMHDLGFSYVMLDITNGVNAWVDGRAKAFIGRLREWNRTVQAPGHAMKFCIALGRTRGISERAEFFAKLEAECRRAWEEFYQQNIDLVHHVDGRPLLVHMLDSGAEGIYQDLAAWDGPRENIDRMTNRVMRGTYRADDGRAYYGWLVPDLNPDHDPELMVCQPGFANHTQYLARRDGDRYKTHWLRVLKADPASVFVISWNEAWEENSIEPAHMFRPRQEAEWRQGKGYPGLTAWQDETGARMDDYYLVLTRHYLWIFLTGNILRGTCFKEESSPDVYRAERSGFVRLGAVPAGSPVLWVPDGFRAAFAGAVVEERWDAPQELGRWSFDHTGSGPQAERMAAALGASQLAGGVSLSPLSVNGSHDFAGFNNLPNTVNDGFGFGGNSGQAVLFIHRANYFNTSPEPDPRPPGAATTWGNPSTAAGVSTSVAGAPLSFTVTPDTATAATIDRLVVEGTGAGADYLVYLQQAGAAAGSSPAADRASMQVPLDVPLRIGPGTSRTFTINLNSGSLNSGHVINTISLHGWLEPADPYLDWAGRTHAMTGSGAGFDEDPDGDGIRNGLEFVLGGDPRAPDREILPRGWLDDGRFVFEFRRAESAAYLNAVAEFGSDLAGWTTAADGVNGVVISESSGGAIPLVRVEFPGSLAAGGRLFVRLRIARPSP